MKIQRIKNSSRNIIWGFMQQLCAVFFPFIIRTQIIKILGAEYLGVSNLFSSILQVLSLAEMGFSSAIVFSLYKPIALDDQKTICALLAYYRRIYRYIGCFILVGGLCMLPFLQLLINGTYPSELHINVLYLIFLFNTVISYFLFSYRTCLLMAHQRNDVYSAITMTVNFVQYIFQIFVLFVSRNYYVYIILLPIATVANNLVCALVTKRMYPQYYCLGKLSGEYRREIRKKIYGLIIGKVNITVKNSFDSIFISAYLSLTDVAIYGNYYYIMASIHVFIGILASSISAGVGNSIVVETEEKNYNDLKKLSFLYNWISSWCCICLLCLYQTFMYIWVGKEMVTSNITMIAFCCYFYSLCAGDIRGVYTAGKGLWWENRAFGILEILGNIVLNWLFVKWWGICGIILASVITTFFIGNVGGMYIVFKRYFHHFSMGTFFLRQAVYVIILVIVGSISYYMCVMVPDEHIVLCFLIRMVICIIVPNLCFYVLYKRFEEYRESKELVVKSLKSLKR